MLLSAYVNVRVGPKIRGGIICAMEYDEAIRRVWHVSQVITFINVADAQNHKIVC